MRRPALTGQPIVRAVGRIAKIEFIVADELRVTAIELAPTETAEEA